MPRSGPRRLARVLDQSLRYTVDKTTREILFLPLPGDIKLQAKSFVDVTVDRGAKAVGALLLLVLVKPWGLHLRLATPQLREPRDGGAVDLHVTTRQAWIPARPSGEASNGATSPQRRCG